MRLSIILSTLLVVLNSSVFAQSENTKASIGFGSFSLINTALDGEWTIEAGGMGGGFISKEFYIGGGGFGLSQENNNYEYDMGYGGLLLGYFWQGSDKTAINFYLLGGYGGVEEDGSSIQKNSDDLWVVRPAAEVDFSLTDWLRIGIGGGYRWILGSDIMTLGNRDLSAPFGSITFRFGNWGN